MLVVRIAPYGAIHAVHTRPDRWNLSGKTACGLRFRAVLLSFTMESGASSGLEGYSNKQPVACDTCKGTAWFKERGVTPNA
jgi:hypothetical protein